MKLAKDDTDELQTKLCIMYMLWCETNCVCKLGEYVANVGYMLIIALGIIVSHYILYYLYNVRWQTSCHGETWVYVTEADSHVLRRSPLIGPRDTARLGTGESREPRGELGSWDLDFERGVLYEKCIRLLL